MKLNVKKIILVGAQSIFIACIVILLVCPLSCHISPEGIEFITGDYVSPKIKSYSVIDDKHIGLSFSEEVEIVSISVNEKEENENLMGDFTCTGKSNIIGIEQMAVQRVDSQDQTGNFIVSFNSSTTIGKSYSLNGIVEDKYGNSLTFSIPFSGYNQNIPKIIITEVQPEYVKLDKNNYRSEFVKFLVLSDGNLSGLLVGTGTNGIELDYHFPPLEVKKGDIIVVHFRKKGVLCINELDNDITLSKAPYSCKIGRDLWLDNQESVFQDNCDIVYLKDTINNKILDGCMYCDGTKTQWPEKLSPLAEDLAEAGIFESSDITNACNNSAVSPTKPLVRNIDVILEKLKNNEPMAYPIKTNKSEWKEQSYSKEITENEKIIVTE